MIGIPNFDVTNQTGKQKFVDYIINLMRNEIISFTSSYNDDDNAASTGVLPNGLVPAGTIVMYGGTVLPDGYLWCDGSQQLIASYTSLFIALGSGRYGVDTATQFYLPDLRSRLSRGRAVPTTDTLFATNNTNTHGHLNNASSITNPTQITTTATLTGTTNNTGDFNSDHSHGVNTGGSHDHTFVTGGGHSHGSGGPSANTNRGATGALVAVASSGHTHGTNNDGGHNHGWNNHPGHGHNTGNSNSTNHSHGFTPAGNITSIQFGATNVGGITTGTVIDNTTYVPAFVEVNYIIKT